MTEKEELQELLVTLRKYDLPVSPILEYAIKEKIEQLVSVEERLAAKSVAEVQENVDLNGGTPRRTKSKSASLLVIRSDGSIIECETSANTFCQAIKEVGVERVFSLKIPMDNMHLITIGGNPQYPTAQHDVGNGYFVNVHSNNITKKRQLERIIKAFGLSWRVEIIDPK